MFALLILPAIPLVIVPLGLFIILILSFRKSHGCDACTALSYSCSRRVAGETCPVFD